MQKRYGTPVPESVRNRLQRETQVIQQMGYVDYFLIVWDYVRYAKQHGIPVGPGRGSGQAASVRTAWALQKLTRWHIICSLSGF